jgi:hypothetical protein
MMPKRGFVLSFALLALSACGSSDEGGVPALPDGFDPSEVQGAKNDLITTWLTVIKGSLAVDGNVSDKTSSSEWFHGYTLELKAKDKINFVGDGDTWGMLRVYGPRTPGGSWGPIRASAYIKPQGKEYVAEIAFTVPKSGTYLAVIGSPWASSYGYTLGATCLAGSCKVQPHCLEYETTDDQGNPLQNFYAINVSSYDEGKQILAKMTDFINEDIRPGTCESQSTICPKVYMPVCGDSPGYEKKTYGNVCEFKVAIRALAGATGEAKGHWEKGICKASYCTIWSCGSQLLACPKVYKPICADTPTTPAKTYGNLCEFKGYVMQQAGDTGEHKGKWTDGACKCDPDQEWWRYYVSTDPVQCKVLKFYCPPYTWNFSNDCGCGCEQSDTCPEWINCMPPTPVPCSEMTKNCPFSKVAY